MKKFLSVVCALLLCLSLTACGGGSSDSSSKELSGKLALNGSTSMEELVNALAEGFKEKNPSVTVEPQFTGSTAGIEALQNGTTDIGDASRALADEEKSAGLTENIVCLDGIAVITDKDNKATNLTTDQLTKIYKGEISNWKEVGGDDEAIVVIGRESGSGTRGAFEELLKIEDACKYAQEIDSTGAVVAKVAQTKGAIGYVSLDTVDDTVIALELDGVKPSVDTVKDGKYTLQRPFVMATKGEVEKQNDLVKAWFDYVNSEDGQKIITDLGLVTNSK